MLHSLGLSPGPTPATRSAQVTISRVGSPFDIDAPGGIFTLAPGQSVTFNVTFSPWAVGSYTDSFTITAQGGYPPQIKKQTVTLTGQGVRVGTEDTYPPTTAPPTTAPPTWMPGQGTTTTPDVTQDVIKLEAKLDAVGKTLDELRQKLDNLGWWLGKLTAGFPLGIEPHSTNPIPETNIWELLAKLEAKLDRMAQQPSEVTAPDINITIIEIYNIIVEINQFITNIGGNVDKLEAKLDHLLNEIGFLLGEIARLAGTLQNISNDLVQIKGDVTKIKGDVTKIKGDITTIKGDITTIKGDITTINTNIRTINTNIGTINTNIGTINTNIGQIQTVVNQNQDAIDVNRVKLNQLTDLVQSLQNSIDRIEDRLNQQAGYPPAPDASKITFTMGGGPAPQKPYIASVLGQAGAVEGSAVVTIYWPVGAPPTTLVADANGAFLLPDTPTGISYTAIKVTQTVNGKESARVRISASSSP